MADSQAALPVCDLRLDVAEPEEEDASRNSLASGESSAVIVKPPPLQVAVAADSMQHAPNTELVYPWVSTDPDAVSIITESTMMTSPKLCTMAVRSESGPRGHDGVTTALLGGSPRILKNNVNGGMEQPQGYGSMQRRHSILRMSASKTSSGNGLRKSASVEFVLDHAHQQAARSIYASTSSIGREPRRLTFEEKAALYRVRPDLEIDPVPYYNDQLEELNRRNQRRIIFAMFGGMISIVLLLVFFSMWEQNK
ncbi:hypothetical protein F441_18869 [Phytophthora nicotianae CJ01A1]|uniref:Uncharacterized protein n=4 Tax=Phytophthora nicotianae TaxID=4792 RepID=V9E614_PHYNI|nr:hypothetical protein F443_19061 [Phytophthora nicotianae P1569]ETK74790.1 hypothetical protein L915_18484 [Phytophthora nicotianae]ETP04295.1 hypothetical protein F441_18869 [Phytophthora nicotianae CJ01A1]ETP32432.1 hypothetical protein F442_18842 [Phytophthora nicotianae P10297]